MQIESVHTHYEHEKETWATIVQFAKKDIRSIDGEEAGIPFGCYFYTENLTESKKNLVWKTTSVARMNSYQFMDQGW